MDAIQKKILKQTQKEYLDILASNKISVNNLIEVSELIISLREEVSQLLSRPNNNVYTKNDMIRLNESYTLGAWVYVLGLASLALTLTIEAKDIVEN